LRNLAFTLIEVLVVIGIIVLIAALLMPVMLSAKRSAKQSSCLSSSKQISLAVRLYMDDSDSVFPVIFHQPIGLGEPLSNWYNWRIGVKAYSKENLECPEAVKNREFPENFSWGYSLNEYTHAFTRDRIKSQSVFRPKNISVVEDVSTTVLFADAHPATVVISSPETAKTSLLSYAVADILTKYRHLPKSSTRHNGGANYSFMDGSLKWAHPDQFDGDRKPFRFFIPKD
jgi:prepilin-type processing-associated H-X9-DG protein